jgi:hypothetical protein
MTIRADDKQIPELMSFIGFDMVSFKVRFTIAFAEGESAQLTFAIVNCFEQHAGISRCAFTPRGCANGQPSSFFLALLLRKSPQLSQCYVSFWSLPQSRQPFQPSVGFCVSLCRVQLLSRLAFLLTLSKCKSVNTRCLINDSDNDRLTAFESMLAKPSMKPPDAALACAAFVWRVGFRLRCVLIVKQHRHLPALFRKRMTQPLRNSNETFWHVAYACVNDDCAWFVLHSTSPRLRLIRLYAK